MKVPDSPFKRIVLVISGLLLVLICVSTIYAKSPMVIVIVLVGAIAGQFIGFSYFYGKPDFPYYTGALILSLALIVLGVRFRKSIWGQASVVVGICAWTLCGFIGLGAVA